MTLIPIVINNFKITERGVNQLFKVQMCEPIETNHASKLNILLSKLLINQHAGIRYERLTHNTVIYVETQFGKNH